MKIIATSDWHFGKERFEGRGNRAVKSVQLKCNNISATNTVPYQVFDIY